MPVTRRRALALIGGGSVLAASAGAGSFLATRTPDAALAPWGAAGGYDDARLNALSWALLESLPRKLDRFGVPAGSVKLFVDCSKEPCPVHLIRRLKARVSENRKHNGGHRDQRQGCNTLHKFTTSSYRVARPETLPKRTGDNILKLDWTEFLGTMLKLSTW